MTQTAPLPLPTRTSKSAIFSLLFGIFGCVPGFSLVALILSFLGIIKTRVPQVRGRWMAIIGLLLGLAFTLVWGAFGFGAWWSYRVGMEAYAFAQAAQKTDAKQLVADLVDVNGPAMQTTRNLTANDVEKFRVEAMKYGQPTGVSDPNVEVESIGPPIQLKISARVQFEKGSRRVQVIVQRDENGKGLRVDKFDVVD